MIKYILKKIGYMIVTLWVILTITFFLMNCIPGDPTQDSMKVLPEAVANNLKARWGLDKPVGEQYIIYLKNLLHGQMESPIRLPALPQTRLFPSSFPASPAVGSAGRGSWSDPWTDPWYPGGSAPRALDRFPDDLRRHHRRVCPELRVRGSASEIRRRFLFPHRRLVLQGYGSRADLSIHVPADGIGVHQRYRNLFPFRVPLYWMY